MVCGCTWVSHQKIERHDKVSFELSLGARIYIFPLVDVSENEEECMVFLYCEYPSFLFYLLMVVFFYFSLGGWARLTLIFRMRLCKQQLSSFVQWYMGAHVNHTERQRDMIIKISKIIR